MTPESRTETSRMSAGYPRFNQPTKAETTASFVRAIFNILTLQMFALVVVVILAEKYITIKRFFLRHTILFLFMMVVTGLAAAALRTSLFTQAPVSSSSNIPPTIPSS